MICSGSLFLYRIESTSIHLPNFASRSSTDPRDDCFMFCLIVIWNAYFSTIGVNEHVSLASELCV